MPPICTVCGRSGSWTYYNDHSLICECRHIQEFKIADDEIMTGWQALLLIAMVAIGLALTRYGAEIAEVIHGIG